MSGELSKKDAQRLSMNAIKTATFGENEYFWINDGDGTLLMHPYSSEMVGTNLAKLTDGKGRYFFRQFSNTAKNGGGWVSYYWQKPNSTKKYPKISFVAYFEPWKWVLGTGIYLDDLRRNVFWTVFQASGLLIVTFFAFAVVTIFIANYFFNQLGELAIKDNLTNLYTKRFLMEVLPTITRQNERNKDRQLAVLFLDIDFFKSINDTYGHDYGDHVLIEVTKCMQNNIRPEDYCIRYGGEEFLVVGSYKDRQSVVDVAERIRKMASEIVFHHAGTDFHITLSAGIAIYKQGEETFTETLKRADDKLYQSKNAGRNCISI